MARKDDQTSSQFDTGFGSGSTFGGTAGGVPKSQAQMGGEFTSGFGGGTNAVSQIFRDGGGSDDKRRKIMLALGSVVVLGAIGYISWVMFLQTSDSTDAMSVATPVPQKNPQVDSKAVDTKATTQADLEESDDAAREGDDSETLDTSVGAPSSSNSYTYNEIGGGPIVQAPPGTSIEVSRNSGFSEMYVTGSTNGSGQFRIPNPPPGKVYWRVAGRSEVSEITVLPPAKLNVALKVGSSIGSSETLQWSADGRAAHFRLEFASDKSFSQIAYSFSTNKTQLTLNGVSPGNYFVRVGGLNVAAGQWEYSTGSAVEIK